jgi:hypothetical protein
MAMAKDKNQFAKSGVEKPIRSGAKPVKKSGYKPMSDRTASESGRWSPRSSHGGGSDMGAPYPGRAYNPPPAEQVKGAATSSDNARAKELLAPDYSNRQVDRSGKFFK